MQGAASAAFSTVLMTCVCIFLSFGSVHWILSSWFARRMYGWQAILLLIGVVIVMYFSIILVVSGNPVGMVIPIGLLGVGLIGRTVSEWADRRQYDRFDEQDIAKYQTAIEIDPRNVAAHSFLADTLRRMGKLAEAIPEYQAALALDPSLKEEKYWLERCRTQLEGGGRPEQMTCPRCGFARHRGQSVCPECGRVYSTLEVWAHSFRSMSPAQRTVWSLVGAAAITLVLAIGALVPNGGRLLVILGLFASSTIMLVASYHDRRRSRSGGP